jgi:DNA-binding CsgD family transcriptional regulator
MFGAANMSTGNLRRVLNALDDLARADQPEQAALAVLDAAVGAVGADRAMLTRLDRRGATTWAWPGGFLSAGKELPFATVHYLHPWPLASHSLAGPGRALRVTDVWSVGQYQVAFSVPTAADHALRVTLQRAGTDFTRGECEELDSLRPCLATAARRPGPSEPGSRAVAPTALTGRERDILGLVATGLSDMQIARRLGISRYTVSKHLHHMYTKTGATNRTEIALLSGRADTPVLLTTDAFDRDRSV